MNFPKFTPIHAKNPRAIILEACKTMELNPEHFISALESELGEEIDLDNPSVSEWVYMCELLALDFDSFSYGYLDYFHKNRIGRYSEEQNAHQQFYPETYKVVSAHVASRFSSQQNTGGWLHV